MYKFKETIGPLLFALLVLNLLFGAFLGIGYGFIFTDNKAIAAYIFLPLIFIVAVLIAWVYFLLSTAGDIFGTEMVKENDKYVVTACFKRKYKTKLKHFDEDENNYYVTKNGRVIFIFHKSDINEETRQLIEEIKRNQKKPLKKLYQ